MTFAEIETPTTKEKEYSRPRRNSQDPVEETDATGQHILPTLSTDEEKFLIARYKLGDEEAEDLLIRHNLALIRKIARKYEYSGVPFEELEQVGREGLLKALEKFDPTRHNKLGTYATDWIMQRISRCAITDQFIRVPVPMVEHMHFVQRCRNILAQELKREPTKAEIIERVKTTPQKRKYPTNANHVEIYFKLSHGEPASLEAPLGSDTDSSQPLTLGDILPNTSHPPVEESVLDEVLYNQVWERVAALLSPEAYAVVFYRMSYDYSFETLGKMVGLSEYIAKRLYTTSIQNLQLNNVFEDFREFFISHHDRDH